MLLRGGGKQTHQWQKAVLMREEREEREALSAHTKQPTGWVRG